MKDKTLRDEIAIAALQGLLSNPQIAKDTVKAGWRTEETWALEAIERHKKLVRVNAVTAYAYADALLKARENER